MKICVHRGINSHLVRHTKVFDLVTGEEISQVFYVDDKKGNVGRYLLDADGHPYPDPECPTEAARAFDHERLIEIRLDSEGKRKLQEYGELPKHV